MHGFVDLQVNGRMGLGFSAPGLTVEDVRTVARDLAARGTVAFCPTIITAPADVYRDNLRTLAEAMEDPEIGGRMPGIHLEGPFISPEPGAVGAHPKGHVRDPSIEWFDRFQEWARGRIRILTLAPERPGAPELIRHAVRQNVLVALGHHMAQDGELEEGVEAGGTLCAHVGNGLPNLLHRHNNPLWWELASDDVTGLFITDGHHLPADLIKVALRAKTVERFIVVSDASPLAGMPPGRYTIFGDLPVVVDETGRISSARTQSLAGSHASMLDCMNYLASLDLLDEADLWRVGFENPLRALGLQPADLGALPGPEVVFRNGRFERSRSGRTS